MEIWKIIEDYPNYMVSNMGRIKSLGNDKNRKEKILKSGKNSRGYLMVNLCKDGLVKVFKVHRLVAIAFIPNPNNYPVVNHIDEDKTNNSVDNLEWCTNQYNVEYSLSKPILQFSKIGVLVRRWNSAKEVERELGIYNAHITACCKGKRKSAGNYKWRYHYKSLWEKKHIPLIEMYKKKKVA